MTRRTIAVAAAMSLALLAGAAHAAPGAPGAPGAKKADSLAADTLRVFDQDLGPAFIDVSHYPPEMQEKYGLFSKKCCKCHTLARPVNSSMKGEEWLTYVTRMSQKAGSGINPKDADQIYDFLVYDSKARARSATTVDPAVLPFLKVSQELGGVARIAAFNTNVPVDSESLRIEVEGDARLDVKRLFASDEGQRMVRWSPREPGKGELIVHKAKSLAGDPPRAGAAPSRAVAQAAAEAVGKEKDPHERVELLLDWLDDAMTKAPVAGTLAADAALAKKSGDATEFTRLFVEMARAAEIPARTRVGLIAQRTSFFYSTWAEVWLGKWIPVDPYLGQFPADMGHLRFALQGDDDLAAWKPGRYAALDRLKLKVMKEGAAGGGS